MSGSNTQGSYFQRPPDTVAYQINPKFTNPEHFKEGLIYTAIGKAATLTDAYLRPVYVCFRHRGITITVKSDSKPAAVLKAWETAVRDNLKRVDFKDLLPTDEVIKDPNFSGDCLELRYLYFKLHGNANVETAIVQGLEALSCTTGRFPHGKHGNRLQLRVGDVRVTITDESNPHHLMLDCRHKAHLTGAVYIDDASSAKTVRQMES